jgi:hypothetical protein
MKMREEGRTYPEIGVSFDVHYMMMKLPVAPWTRAANGELIERTYSIALRVRTIGHSVPRWGCTAQKPIERAYERRSEAIAQRIRNTGLPRFVVLTKAIDAPTLLSFLQRRCKDADRKVVLFLDNMNVH